MRFHNGIIHFTNDQSLPGQQCLRGQKLVTAMAADQDPALKLSDINGKFTFDGSLTSSFCYRTFPPLFSAVVWCELFYITAFATARSNAMARSVTTARPVSLFAFCLPVA
tara:strand:+ start:2977 stop:3306 length:330 start_codon:yes stop_codon:yes gene_type:complete